MSNIKGITKWPIAALLMTNAWLIGGCDESSQVDIGVEDVVDEEVDIDVEGEADEDFRAWTGYTSEEYPPLICPNRYAVRGVDCAGDYCDDTSLDCRFTGRGQGEHTWLPYISEEGAGTANEAHCDGNNMWMTGITCSGDYCDNVSIRCSALLGTTTGNCTWSEWFSEEQAPFRAPNNRYVKGIECGGSYCDNKRYRHCRMY